MERNRKLELGLLFAVSCYAGAKFAQTIRKKSDERKAKKSGKRAGVFQRVRNGASRLRRSKTPPKR